ncbi:MAG: hypothetical protein JWQ09_2101, partial [Segetibacter sp.]|nr:hypothetical protein [Segetibacter sp.]
MLLHDVVKEFSKHLSKPLSLKKTEAEKILHKVHSELENQQLYPSLLGGSAGVALFKVLYFKYFRKGFDEKLLESIQQLAESSLINPNFEFSSGVTGINWFFAFLLKNGIITRKDFKAACFDDKILKEKSFDYLKEGNYDFLHGGIGIAYYILYAHPKTSKSYAQKFIEQLLGLISSEFDMIPSLDFMAKKLDRSKINLGLAHGIPSILKFCLECSQLYNLEKAKDLSLRILSFMMASVNGDDQISVFPTTISKPSNNQVSRLGWCYGDLTNAYIMYQAASFYKLPDIADFAIRSMVKTTRRKTFDQTFVADSGICHGNIGLAHIYNKVWIITRLTVFKQARQYWIEKSLKEEPYGDGQLQMSLDHLQNKYKK